MVPAQSNYKVGQYTLDYILSNITEVFGVRKLMRRVAVCLIEPRVRKAFLYVSSFRYYSYCPP